MSGTELRDFLGEHWGKALVVGAFVVGGYVARIEASIAQVDEVAVSQEVVRGIGRLVCVAERDKAVLAGIPCGQLLDEWAGR
jgi:hypothetical protein